MTEDQHDIVLRLLPLVHRCARRFRGTRPLADKVQDGIVGALKAVKKWRPEKGALSTIAYHRVINAILDGLCVEHNPRLPRHFFETAAKVRKERQRIASEKLGPVSADDIANATGLACESVERALSIHHTAPLELLPHLACTTGSDELIASLDQKRAALDIKSALDRVNPVERQVIRYRFGIDGCGPLTLRALATMLKKSAARIGQIEKRALEKLRILLARWESHSRSA